MKGITVDEMITRFIEQARLVPGFKGSVDEILLAHDLRTGTRRFDVFDGGLLGLAIPTNWV